ncbi:single-stranded-DNA-specific exonuclease RecJ [Mammaliicoccus lentus]|jgi:single-stranded-DNA-specific exonuclease|uniref:Single-stranded-DNA-specific exonuclease RecJ n=1 Tax=Mammaliicoccus lentus TaxID=42858 RepID=A0AAX3W1D5_MAMLE|nr:MULTISPECIES: single-stranded-DNA-specific exonuclease RecJ [Mammaliicoccus]MCR1872636.1 single-stranded-DNA-specific exonuclease RecJ [Mammaliicoccus lentus]MEB5684752.1 single-stranded-DNA-specific exonuclease RecJ [Mammaliicoccus lentus]QMU11253.1 single-stranded-DNA-specific exonuclease RecJ [Mammaliicoccus lentus]WGZ43937.1 single-stranded-DNA-specific exonuclease RecJ [Mammaliicoccus lentus]WHI58777.1 single-stranded-DNA-specific exonuclease RecJ [Mammaliicoccus lentus]
MTKARYQWSIPRQTIEIDKQIIKKFNISPLLEKALVSKGYTTQTDIEHLLSKEELFHDPMLLSDMEKAVSRIHKAIENSEKILVYGDYDADGVTSTTILVKTLESLGAQVGWYIPNRFTEGYGPSEGAFRNAHDEDVTLIITVDNGVQGHHEIDIANELGIDVIVTDHHEFGITKPNAYAIVHPMHPDFDYPFEYLAGVGVSYKLCKALKADLPDYFLGLVAIGTIADLVSLTDENRYMVKRGLNILNEKPSPGIKALLEVADYTDEVSEQTVGFIIGPRLNAVGRLDDARLACELLMCEDSDEATFLAEEVDHFNTERKAIVETITEEALVLAQEQIDTNAQFLVLAKEDWNEGVLGIVASRIVEQYHLPTIVLNVDIEQNHAKGSARSIEQVSMFEFLQNNSELIQKFGGHHMAAGMTLDIDAIESLKKALNDEMYKLTEGKPLLPQLTVDSEIQVSDISVENIFDLERLRPFGTDISAPLFAVKNVQVNSVKGIGQSEKHLKLTLTDKNIAALHWNFGHLQHDITNETTINIAGSLNVNEWNGHQSPQIIVKDLELGNEHTVFDYRSKNKQDLLKINQKDALFVVNSTEEKLNDRYVFYGEGYERNVEACVLRDLPKDLDDLKITLNQVNADKYYLVFKGQSNSYFEGLPNEQKFKETYKALLSKAETNIQTEGMQLCQFLKIKPDQLKFILNCFYELDFITINDGIIKVNKEAEKNSIQSAPLYQEKKRQIEIEKTLLYNDSQSLIKWIQSLIGNVEEEV